jgi:glucose-6-phosphate dehydrogenase assembly protein OpcA
MTTATENPIFDALPGMEVPVGGISAAFKKLWADSPAEEMRAMQLNLVLHLGANTEGGDANEQFRTTVRFSQRYPCRVVVLCPHFDEASPAEIRAKIYGECSTGKSKNDTRCCEFVILHYTMAARGYLENQVSVCLSTDLPLYYWAHRFSAARRLADYSYLLTRSKRVMFDSAIVPSEALTYPWPNQSAVRDLAYTRTLPLRQNLGQFLSRYAPTAISDGLKSVTMRHRDALAAEAACLLGWISHA